MFGSKYNSPPNAHSILFFNKNISDENKLKFCFGSVNIFIIAFNVEILLFINAITFLLFELAIRHFIIDIYSVNNLGLNLFSIISFFSKYCIMQSIKLSFNIYI